jgi:hypothetical protein
MPTIEWLRNEFHYGYNSGNVLSVFANRVRRAEERKIGGSYRKVFFEAIRPYLRPDSTVLELGPGMGSWSRAILRYIPNGRLITVDFQDVATWLKPERYQGRLECHQVSDLTLSCVEAESVDFFWSMGVLCHNNLEHIRQILANALPKMRFGGVACHQFGCWEKLAQFGWKRGGIPEHFRQLEDDRVWWPRNSCKAMNRIAQDSGWQVLKVDLQLVQRDGIILLRRNRFQDERKNETAA